MYLAIEDLETDKRTLFFHFDFGLYTQHKIGMSAMENNNNNNNNNLQPTQ